MTYDNTHANRGRSWQADVEAQHVAYTRADRCTWIRNEPVRTVQRGETYDDAVERVTQGRGAPDYTVICDEGVLLVEVKDCDAATWRYRALDTYQAARLEAGDRRARCRGFVLLRLQGQPFLLPWREIAEGWHRNKPRAFAPTWGHLADTDYLDTALAYLR